MGIGEAQTIANNRLTAVPPSLGPFDEHEEKLVVIVAGLHVPIVEEHALSPQTGFMLGAPRDERAGAAGVTSQ